MAYNREVLGRSNECEKMLSAERSIHGEKECDMYIIGYDIVSDGLWF